MRRHVVIGDIHGCFVELQQLLEQVELAADDVLVSVGDLVDRGPESPRVVAFFRERPNTLVVAGNHERKHVRGIFSYAQEITRLQFGSEYADAVAWMGSLRYYLELDAAIVVHAALLPGEPLAEQQAEVLCGSTSGEKELQRRLGGARWHEQYAGPLPVIFGHHVVAEPLIRSGLVYGIDTGACHGGRLTALTLPDFRLHSVPAREDHWRRTKREWQADVLAARPWATLLWPELDEQLARVDAGDEPRSRDFVIELRHWRKRVDVRTDEVLAALQAEAARLDAEAGAAGRAALAEKHPLGRFMFQCFRGRLDRARLLAQVHTAAGLDAVARALGFSPVGAPPPPRCPR